MVATLCGFKAKTIYEARPLSMCLSGVESHYSSSSRKRKYIYLCVCVCVFTITWANSTFARLYWGEKQNKEVFLLMTLARLGKWVGERAPGWSSLTPAAPGARRGQHTIAVGRTGTWPCATRNFLSLTCCSSVCVFNPIDTIIYFVWRWRLIGSCTGRKVKGSGAENSVTCTCCWVFRPLWQWHCSGGKRFWWCGWPDAPCEVCHMLAVSDLHRRDLRVRDQMTGWMSITQ